MSFRELDIKRSYISKGEDSMAKSFLVPVLKKAKSYKRSVGFFSSSALTVIVEGIVELYRNNGNVKLIASPQLKESDIEAIKLGYEQRNKIIEDAFSSEFESAVEFLNDSELELLARLIANGMFDIKIAVTDSVGIYHDKLGIIEDMEGNKIAFYGSSNSSKNGYQDNYEKIRLSKSWEMHGQEIVEEEEHEFDDLWSGNNPFVQVYEYNEAAHNNIINVIKKRSEKTSKNEIKLRDYQTKAINAWVNNEYRGFYVMATGTGKTWTAIYSAKKLLEKKQAMIVICAPYKHLVKQWAEDVVNAFPEAEIILVSSENTSWSKQIKEAIIRKRYQNEHQIIIISTIMSFNMDRFKDALSISAEDKLLIVDEAHRFTNIGDDMASNYKFMLGLSATPFSGSSAKKGKELMTFFGGEVFNLPIEDALAKGYLVNYYYKPIFLYANQDEEDRFSYHTKKIASCFKNGVCINKDLLIKSLRNRLRVISMAEQKQVNLKQIVENINDKENFVVYCGDGKLFDTDSGEEVRHIQSVKQVLTELNLKTSQFTAQENMKERMQLVEMFNKRLISSLAAIRCLDEGINIPSIKSALILSSNDDYREFVQRRGRILRKYKDKEFANIYDIIVLPSTELMSWAKIEFRRFYEYAKLSLNWDELKCTLNDYLSEYNLELEDIDVYDYENMEEDLDE